MTLTLNLRTLGLTLVPAALTLITLVELRLALAF